MSMLNIENIKDSMLQFSSNLPFNHCVIDNFFTHSLAEVLSEEFMDYKSNDWFLYKNPLEEKKAQNNWNLFPKNTYNVFMEMLSESFVELLSGLIGKKLFPDFGLHGGGWHIHARGGNLNPHLDYSIHPKLGLQRKINIIIYLSKELEPSIHGGHFGLWEHNFESNGPGQLIKEIEPLFNRAVLFDTTQNSWHGIARPLNQPIGIYRKSLAIYYLCKPTDDAKKNQRALFAPRDFQKNDKYIEEIIKLRSETQNSSRVYRTKK